MIKKIRKVIKNRQEKLAAVRLGKTVDTLHLMLIVPVAGIIAVVGSVAAFFALDLILFFASYALWMLFSNVIPADGLAVAFFLMNKFFALFLGDWFINLGLK